MKSVERTGKTIDDAITSALDYLRVTRERVNIEVLEEPSRGILGLIGTRLAKVKVTVKDKTTKEIAEKFLKDVVNAMNLNIDFSMREEGNNLYITILGKDVGVLIGKRGQTLDSIQYLANLVVNKNRDKYVKVFVDSENYREKREETLVRLAKRLADKAIRTNKNVVLEPMNPYERRIIHSSLQNNPYVETYSEGDEPYRKVVIAKKVKK